MPLWEVNKLDSRITKYLIKLQAENATTPPTSSQLRRGPAPPQTSTLAIRATTRSCTRPRLPKARSSMEVNRTKTWTTWLETPTIKWLLRPFNPVHKPLVNISCPIITPFIRAKVNSVSTTILKTNSVCLIPFLMNPYLTLFFALLDGRGDVINTYNSRIFGQHQRLKS